MTTFDQVWPVAAFFLGVVSTLLIETIKARRTREEDLRRRLQRTSTNVRTLGLVNHSGGMN